MALSIWDDEDLVESLGYGAAFDRNASGFAFMRRAGRREARVVEKAKPRKMTVAELRAKARANMHRRIEEREKRSRAVWLAQIDAREAQRLSRIGRIAILDKEIERAKQQRRERDARRAARNAQLSLTLEVAA